MANYMALVKTEAPWKPRNLCQRCQ